MAAAAVAKAACHMSILIFCFPAGPRPLCAAIQPQALRRRERA